MKKYFFHSFLTLLLLAVASGVYGQQVNVCLSLTKDTLAIVYTPTANFNTPQTNRWNSQLITVRYPNSTSVSFTSPESSGDFSWEQDSSTPGSGIDGQDGYRYVKFVANIVGKTYDLFADQGVTMFWVKVTTAAPVTFEVSTESTWAETNNGEITISNALLGNIAGVITTDCESQTPACVQNVTAAAGSCDPTTNQYSVSGTVSLTNATAGTLTITDGARSTTVAVAALTTLASYTLTGLISGSGSHTVTASLSGCGTDDVTYTAPPSCTLAPKASLGNYVFEDRNANGVQDDTDKPIVGVTVTLLSSGTLVAKTLTDPSGLYSFTGLTPGVPYSVSFTTPANYTATTPNRGNDDTKDSDPIGGITTPLSLTSGENNTTLDAGFYLPAAIQVAVSEPICNALTNVYTATGTVNLTNAIAGDLLITDTGTSLTVISIMTGQTTASFSLTGVSNGPAIRGIVATLASLSATTTYSVPLSCTRVASPKLTLDKLVDRSKAQIGDILTYQLTLRNIGTETATNVVALDSLDAGLQYIAGSAQATAGSFAPASFGGNWTVPLLTAGSSATLTMSARVMTSGVLYNVAVIPGDTNRACTSIPIEICPGEQLIASGPGGRTDLKWYRNGILAGSSAQLVITEPGLYTVQTAAGTCPDNQCCPLEVIASTNCCVVKICVPIVIQQIKRAPRIGDK